MIRKHQCGGVIVSSAHLRGLTQVFIDKPVLSFPTFVCPHSVSGTRKKIGKIGQFGNDPVFGFNIYGQQPTGQPPEFKSQIRLRSRCSDGLVA